MHKYIAQRNVTILSFVPPIPIRKNEDHVKLSSFVETDVVPEYPILVICKNVSLQTYHIDNGFFR